MSWQNLGVRLTLKLSCRRSTQYAARQHACTSIAIGAQPQSLRSSRACRLQRFVRAHANVSFMVDTNHIHRYAERVPRAPRGRGPWVRRRCGSPPPAAAGSCRVQCSRSSARSRFAQRASLPLQLWCAASARNGDQHGSPSAPNPHTAGSGWFRSRPGGVRPTQTAAAQEVALACTRGL
jgi:hypothetical protein